MKTKKSRVIVRLPNGDEMPVWALRAGQLITATDYDVGKRVMTISVMDLPPRQLEEVRQFQASS